MSSRVISLRGVEVHNLKHVDLDLAHRRLIVFCGVSGSGKTSLALDTLYAEGQRRYIETFSAYTRQFLERLEKPAAERIDGIPPAIAVTRKNPSRSSRATVGTATETYDHLRLLMAKIGELVCHGCGRPVRRESPQSIAAELAELPAGTRIMVGFALQPSAEEPPRQLARRLQREGFVRAIAGEQTINLADAAASADGVAGKSKSQARSGPLQVVVDRLTAGDAAAGRLRDSLETAFQRGHGACLAWIDAEAAPAGIDGKTTTIDGRRWVARALSDQLCCTDCGLDYPEPEPRLFSFNSPLGACPECEGFGNIIDIDMDLVVPDVNRTLREGAIAPWNSPAYAHELEELFTLADDYNVPLDVPYGELTDAQRRILMEGVPERDFGGLRGFFAWLERRKYKMHLRVFLSRWRSYHPCPACRGARLRPEALAFKLGGLSIAELAALKIRDAVEFLRGLALGPWQRAVGRTMLDEVRARLGYLEQVGLGYLTLDRTLRTLSGGEAQRVALTSALGSSLVNLLYVLDEPSVGLHPADVARLVGAIENLRDRQNTLIVVEHEEALLRAADEVVEIGPGAGENGGRVVFQGPPDDMLQCTKSLTGAYLAGRRGNSPPAQRRKPERGWIELVGARGNNLKNLTVRFPLGMLALVTGVSGSGKSTLVQDTLYPALCRRRRKDAPRPLDCDDVLGAGQIDDVVLVDQSPIGRSPRSNPVTYIKAFDAIRNVFAETVEARTRNFSPSHFSFNVDGGRCTACKGDGYLRIDMQFLADVYMKCAECNGERYRREILAVKYRGRNIADVLRMTVREAFSFFRGHAAVQTRLKPLIDVGLDYVQLGQPANTLSGGEAQRLKLATFISSPRRGRILFMLDEPTTGLHFSDVVQLLDCFESLLSVGHSLLVVEHNLQVMKAADYLIDLGPGAADEGGTLVVAGSPEEVASHKTSATGRYLRAALAAQLPADAD